MKHYIYRFLGERKELLYIGKTSNLKQRISGHLSGSHLTKDKRLAIKYIEYQEFENKVDMDIKEVYLIAKYKPPFNTVSKYKDEAPTIEIKDDRKWIEYIVVSNERKKIMKNPPQEPDVPELKIEGKRGRKRIRGEMERLSFSISNKLYDELKDYTLTYGMTLQTIVHRELEVYLQMEEKPVLELRYGKEYGDIARGVDLSSQLKEKFDEHTKVHKLKKRFIIEGLLSKFINENKKI